MNVQSVADATRAQFRAKIRAFRAEKTAHPGKREGRGSVYLVANVDNDDIKSWRAGTLDDPGLIARTAFKAGHTNRLPRRQSQYQKCARGRTIVWMAHYRVSRRYFIERFIHLRLFKHGGQRVRFACSCCVNHREYMALDSLRGFAAVDSRITDVLLSSGEQMDRETLPRPMVNEDLYDLILHS
ncbi:hypothetical protein C8R47DRAFT_1224350 [Mycena vitilis]|nr:hypothetical protein C8R47DRAFT_1224350 [Mycena vitilis]